MAAVDGRNTIRCFTVYRDRKGNTSIIVPVQSRCPREPFPILGDFVKMMSQKNLGILTLSSVIVLVDQRHMLLLLRTIVVHPF